MSWHGVVETGGPFEPEPGRYHLYIGTITRIYHETIKQY